MTYQTVFPPHITIQVKKDDVRINKDNWYYTELGINLVMSEANKITSYFKEHIPNWVKDHS